MVEEERGVGSRAESWAHGMLPGERCTCNPHGTRPLARGNGEMTSRCGMRIGRHRNEKAKKICGDIMYYFAVDRKSVV